MNNSFQLTGDYLDDSFRLASFVGGIHNSLHSLAKAFRRVGNEDLAIELFETAADCEVVYEAIRKIVDSETSRGLHDAQKMSGQILLSCLAGLKLGEEGLTQPKD